MIKDLRSCALFHNKVNNIRTRLLYFFYQPSLFFSSFLHFCVQLIPQIKQLGVPKKQQIQIKSMNQVAEIQMKSN